MNPMDKYPPRPGVTDSMRLAAAQVISDGMGDDSGNLVEDLAGLHMDHADGYELCRALENECDYYGSMEMAEELDSYSSELRRICDAAEKRWEAEHAIAPPLAAGTRITKGVITGVSNYRAASYVVDEGKPHSYLIVRFEDAVLESDVAAAL